MMLIRLLFYFLIIYFIYVLIKRYFRQLRQYNDRRYKYTENKNTTKNEIIELSKDEYKVE